MSGIYIKGMEMPDRCYSCPLCNVEPDGESSCAKSLGPVIEYKEIDIETVIDTRPDWCPLVPVPPHGDLIDRRQAAKYALPRTEMVDGEIVVNHYVYLETIQQLPTIIPASGGKENE